MTHETSIREALCDIGVRVWTRGFAASNDGNFSFRLSEDAVMCTPTMISKGFMKPDDMIIVDMAGRQIAGHRRATSEIRIHLSIYKQRPGVYSVVHVHPPHATAFAVARRKLPQWILPEAEVMIGEIPSAPFELPGTWEFARTIDPWLHSHNAFLLENHGALALGQDPYDAYYRMETLDQYCRILLLAVQAGGWKKLDADAISQILMLKKKLGIRDTRTPEDWKTAPLTQDAKFRPHPGPITDAPKTGGYDSAGDACIDEIAREVARRLGV